MVQVFAKRFWGFDPQRWPIVSFGLEANRDSLIKASKAGDLMVFIGTQTEPTAPEDQGRLLGIAEIGRQPINSLDVLDPANLRPDDYKAEGQLKWPKALPMLRAWRLIDKPRVTEVLRKQLTMEATIRAVLLDAVDTQAVLALRREQVDVPDLEIIRRFRDVADAVKVNRPTRGPVPSSWSGQVTRDASLAATTYALRYGARNVWKIGHAQDVKGRLAEVNKHVPHEVLGERWSIVLTQLWATQAAAYEMEQRVLARLTSNRTEGERLICGEHEVKAAWVEAMIPGRG